MPLSKTFQIDSFDTLNLSDGVVRSLPVHDQLLYWAAHEWNKHYPDKSYVPVWAAHECANKLALQRVKPGRKLKGDARYMGYTPLFCPYIMPIETYETVGRREFFTTAVGAYLFSFETS